ncbi:hypothetical protein SLU01_27230 [Sporosarcina luteola]|uniref:Uncharacterized protein n=1 Tax=Sporosarcina luteola TaxID=582850 RepID=A0A511ZAF1_9BACL|nr:hypothetical protein [Sporosarcina luteola]GEN84411.1 hypothetical protein SLU01_27230 [Sporosarcina luteola]
MKKKMAMAALGLGAAYLMRNKDARNKLSKQFETFGSTPMRGEKTGSQSHSRTASSKKGLGSLFS